MKYFSKYFLRPSDLRVLRRGLMESRSHRIVNYAGNWKAVQEHEKLVRVRGDSPLWDELDALQERIKDVWIDFEANPPRPYNYEWDKLSSAMKRYIHEQDEIQYHEYYKRLEGPTKEDYERRLTRLEKTIPNFTDREFERYVLLGHPIPTPTFKKALDSARRAYQEVNGILKCNINEFTEFITLTFAYRQNEDKHKKLGLEFEYVDGFDFASAKKAFTKWMDNLQKRAKRKGYSIKYVCTWEMQGSGNYHFHLVTNSIPESEKISNPAILAYDSISRQYENSVGLLEWKHGKSDVQRISSHERIATYLSKYILKSMYNICEDEEMLEKYRGQKKYFPSKGLKRPEVIYADDYEEDIAVEPYETERINPYNQGLIKNRVYTLIKEKDAINGALFPSWTEEVIK